MSAVESSFRAHRILPDAPYASYRDYLAATGESALERARAQPGEAVLEEILRSGLRGRGGAGFPTGTKWRTIARHACPTRTVVCNAAEGEPGTFKDRWLIRRNPYAILEGMLVAAHVVGARSLYFATQAAFRPELARLRAAIQEMTDAGLLAGLELTVALGPEEYLFGEEKALLEVISGNEPLPREPDQPPYEVGLFATATSPNPALVNNAQTFAHVPSIVREGAASFRRLGTHDTPGTLLFTVSGDVQRPGIYELEAGTTLLTLFHEVAGGPRAGRALKAALSGVASGVIAADQFDTPADFASLHRIGAGLGSAGFMVFDDRASMPRLAQAAARFLYVESCNQCSACKHGLRTASQALDRLFDREKATAEDLPRALFGARSAPQANRCYLPVQASVLLPSLLERFHEEFEGELGAPGRAPPMLLPRLLDFDEATRTFTLDERQATKRPDWTYAEETGTPLDALGNALIREHLAELGGAQPR